MSYISNSPISRNDLGYFVDLTALQTAYPTGQDGQYATLGSTDTIWTWDTTTSAWVDTGNTGYVPYTGGDQDLDLGAHTATLDGVIIDTSATPRASVPGLIQWNATDGTYDMGLLNSSVLQVGQETYFYGKASGAIANGELCEFAGVQGDHILIKKAVGSEIEANPHYMVGVATQNITNGNYGYVTWFGKINGVYTKTPANGDTADWTAGDILYFNITTGQLTKTKPSAPNRIITVAVVIKEQTGASETGVIIVRPQIGLKLEDLDDVDGGAFDTNGQTIVWNNDEEYFTRSNALPISHHYTGFPDRTATSLSWDDGTYTLTLTATADPIWIDGIEYPINTLTKQLSVAQEAVSGLYWFWLTQSGGTVSLNADTNAPGFDKCLVATVYWNTTTKKGIIADERHWMGRDRWMHEYLHETIGARYASGMGPTFTNTTFQIDDGEFYDEDIEHDLGGNITTAKVLYHNGDADWAWDILTTPYKVVNPGVDDTLYYNNGNALATVDNNKFVNQWVFATGDITHPIHIIIGTAQYATIALARAASVPALGSLGTAENKLIFKVTYKNVTGTPTYVETTDYRSSTNLPVANYVAMDHGSLTGLGDNDHPQYALATDLSNYVPYTGATGNVDLGANDLIIGGEGIFGRIYSPDAITADTEGGKLEMYAGVGLGTGNGGCMDFTTGDSNGSGNGGDFNFTAGGGGDTGAGGSFIIFAGAGGASGGQGGNIELNAGSAQGGDADGGSIYFRAGTKAGAGTNGTYNFYSLTSDCYGILDFETELSSSDKTYTFPDNSGTIALTSDISNYVPYTGADQDLDLGEHDLIIGAEGMSGRIFGSNAITADTTGCHLELYAGFGLGTGDGGSVSLGTGDGGDTGSGGSFNVIAGNGGESGGNGGEISFTAGSAQGGDADGGSIYFLAGTKAGAGTNGTYKFYSVNGLCYGILDFETLSSDQTYTFPDKSGTVAMTSDIPTSTIVQTVNDADMDATDGTIGQIVFNTADSKFYGCVTTGTPGTWVAFH